MTKMFSDALCSDRAPLVSYYGAIAGLQELGPEVIKVFVLPHIGKEHVTNIEGVGTKQSKWKVSHSKALKSSLINVSAELILC